VQKRSTPHGGLVAQVGTSRGAVQETWRRTDASERALTRTLATLSDSKHPHLAGSVQREVTESEDDVEPRSAAQWEQAWEKLGDSVARARMLESEPLGQKPPSEREWAQRTRIRPSIGNLVSGAYFSSRPAQAVNSALASYNRSFFEHQGLQEANQAKLDKLRGPAVDQASWRWRRQMENYFGSREKELQARLRAATDLDRLRGAFDTWQQNPDIRANKRAFCRSKAGFPRRTVANGCRLQGIYLH
jgi:hypothetical protein